MPHSFSDFKGLIQILHSLIGQREFYFYIEHIFLSGCQSPKPHTQTLVITRI